MIKLKRSFYLLKKRKIYERLDFYPFLIIKLILFAILLFLKMKKFLYYIIAYGVIYLLQIILYFLNHVFIEIGIKIGYFYVNNIDNATHVKILICSNTNDINNRIIISKIVYECNLIKIEIDKMIYIYNKDSKQFYRSKYELIKQSKLSDYLEIKPISSLEIPQKKARYGSNIIEIPSPSFLYLYKEHIITPFFIFHLICSLIRIFDNNSYKYIISLIITLIFEITITWKRIFNSATIKNMKTPPHYVNVYRDEEWSLVSSADIYPGDIISLNDGYCLKNIKENEKNSKNNLIFRILNLLNNIKIRQQEKKNQKSLNTVLNKYKEKEVLPITCDVLILNGKAVVNEATLNGKSLPLIKNSIYNYSNLNVKLDIKKTHKNNIIFGGSKIVQIENSNKIIPINVKKNPPNNGIICLVLKTGFSTYQGKILHKILFNKVRRHKNNKKNQMIFITFLFLIALLSSIYTLLEARRRDELSYPIILRIVIILTSIVPVDLPIELSLILYKCISYFESKSIVCIEPAKIPSSGTIDICCFDLIGTLTTDEFNILGIINLNDIEELIPCIDCEEDIVDILLGCHNLSHIDDKAFGEPIDIAIFKKMKGKFNLNEISCPNKKIKIEQIKKYMFDSELKRMTVLAKIYNENEKPYIKVMCKGAPEIIKKLLKIVPKNYDECYIKWTKKGYHLIALAYKDVEGYNSNTERNILEKDLIFAGFCVYEIPIKDKVDKYLKELIKSKYDLCIITGESLLTALKLITQLNLFESSKYAYLSIQENQIFLKDIDTNQIIQEAKTIEDIKNFSKEYILCIANDEYKKLDNIKIKIPAIYSIIPFIKLFSRMSKSNKIQIISDLKSSGRNPLMCGDGTNDVGALKLAKVGVTLLNIKESFVGKREFLYFEEDTIIKNWDTTAVTPFISKGESIKCIKNILLTGKLALIINIQMHKIFIINSISTIYIESILALKGIKFSEYQYANLSFIISLFFLMFSKAKPLNKLNPNRPAPKIINLKNVISIIGQIIINISSMNLLLYFSESVDPFLIGQEKSLDEKFRPNLNNTIIYMFQILSQVNIFVANYQGEPFMENINKNSSMMKLIFGILAIGSIYIFDLYPQVNDDFEMVALPEDNLFKFYIILILVLNFCLCYILEKWKNIFGLYEPYEKSNNKKKKN
jgi:cation-transporting ATPase 13A1